MKRTRIGFVLAVIVVILVVSYQIRTPHSQASHPVFNTPVSTRTPHFPAVQVDVLDKREGWWGTAELYMSVQSSRFPADTRILLPINIGDFQGCMSRFVQLPFELHADDVLLVELLDEDKLTAAQEKMLVDACRTFGFCVCQGAAIYSPQSQIFMPTVRPVVITAAEMLGKAIAVEFRTNSFKNVGRAEFITPGHLPDQPNKANKLSLLDDVNRARVQVRIYGQSHSP